MCVTQRERERERESGVTTIAYIRIQREGIQWGPLEGYIQRVVEAKLASGGERSGGLLHAGSHAGCVTVDGIGIRSRSQLLSDVLGGTLSRSSLSDCTSYHCVHVVSHEVRSYF